ncbi:MAG: hypothetical protein SXQ77_12270, partial [Halobacteria archaeon]|nr:hypothetical protein [Halobacteria archaeon]
MRVTGTSSEHDAYFEAKRDWYELMEDELPLPSSEGLPGDTVVIDGHEFHVHGVTHAGTDEERDFLREHVSASVENGAFVYCEQGIRSMYFCDFSGACEMDDYRWAMKKCDELGIDSHVELPEGGFDGFVENIDSFTAEFRHAVFKLIDSGGGIYGDGFKNTLGNLASDFFTSHENMATGDDFEAYTKARDAAKNPSKLGELQRYYKKKFLPQPLEREWLRRHDREVELMTHARNERMAD